MDPLVSKEWGREGILCGCYGEAAWTLFLAAPESSQPGHLPTLAPPMIPLEVGKYVSSQAQGLQPQWPSLEGQTHPQAQS